MNKDKLKLTQFTAASAAKISPEKESEKILKPDLAEYRIMVIQGKARRHGFQGPLSVFQIASWVVAVFIFVSACLSTFAISKSIDESGNTG